MNISLWAMKAKTLLSYFYFGFCDFLCFVQHSVKRVINLLITKSFRVKRKILNDFLHRFFGVVEKRETKRQIPPLLHVPESINKCLILRLFSRFFADFRHAGSLQIYHYTLAFKPDFFLEQRNTINYGCFPNEDQWSLKEVFNTKHFIAKSGKITTTQR